MATHAEPRVKGEPARPSPDAANAARSALSTTASTALCGRRGASPPPELERVVAEAIAKAAGRPGAREPCYPSWKNVNAPSRTIIYPRTPWAP